VGTKNQVDAKLSEANGNSELEGEGSYTATEHYNAGVEKTVKSGKVDELAKKAEKALDGPEGKELARASEAAKKGHSLKAKR
jgi:hypothetical protein